jgi:hypothetical protein
MRGYRRARAKTASVTLTASTLAACQSPIGEPLSSCTGSSIAIRISLSSAVVHMPHKARRFVVQLTEPETRAS